MGGDPHYRTFDGQYFEYQGTCPYVFVEPCHGTLPQPYNYFSVKAKNEKVSPTSHVSVVTEVEVEMYGQKLHVDCSYTLLFNGIRTGMNFYYPNKNNPKITATYSGGQVVIANDQNVRVRFQCYRLCVEIPDDKPLQGSSVLCGLAGNRDFNCKDDFRRLDGYVYNVTSCQTRYKKVTEIFGDSYITKDFLITSSKEQQCLTGVEVTNGSITCDLGAGKAKCQPILDAAHGKGPFAACQ
ncbi:unnamed protein product, partial [Anisakis simplex]|uniref:VWFD domain-containing protein n=1 Tax=Anisakis simplex TaxID=6269 RepID=A0A0M3K4C2_ANISI